MNVVQLRAGQGSKSRSTLHLIGCAISALARDLGRYFQLAVLLFKASSTRDYLALARDSDDDLGRSLSIAHYELELALLEADTAQLRRAMREDAESRGVDPYPLMGVAAVLVPWAVTALAVINAS